MTVTAEQGESSRAAVDVSPEENSGTGQGKGISPWDEEPLGMIAWGSSAMPNGDPSSLTLWGTEEQR